MNRIVSSTMAGIAVEAGELFGVPRQELLDLLPDPTLINKPWHRLEWDHFVDLMKCALRTQGTGEDWIEAGRTYKRERYNLRSAHLYAQFKNWERAFWVSKHLVVGRLIQGYSMEYKRLEDDYFWFELRLPEHLQPFPDFLYFSIGVWSGSSRQANLQNDLRNVSVSSHSGTAEIRFDERSLKSKAAFNPLYSRWKTHNDLKKCLQDEKEAICSLERETIVLRQAMSALHDAVFFLEERSGEDLAERNETAEKSETSSTGWFSPSAVLPGWITRPEASINHLHESIEKNFNMREELEQKRDHLKKLFDAVSDIVLVYQHGKPVLLNRQATQLLHSQGTDRNEDLQEYIFKRVDRVMAGHPHSFTCFKESPEERHLVISSCTPIDRGEGTSLLVTLLDLTGVQALLKRISDGEHLEKSRIRRDLHDGLTQCLTSLALQSKALTLIHSSESCQQDLETLSAKAGRCLQLCEQVYRSLPEE